MFNNGQCWLLVKYSLYHSIVKYAIRLSWCSFAVPPLLWNGQSYGGCLTTDSVGYWWNIRCVIQSKVCNKIVSVILKWTVVLFFFITDSVGYWWNIRCSIQSKVCNKIALVFVWSTSVIMKWTVLRGCNNIVLVLGYKNGQSYGGCLFNNGTLSMPYVNCHRRIFCYGIAEITIMIVPEHRDQGHTKLCKYFLHYVGDIFNYVNIII